MNGRQRKILGRLAEQRRITVNELIKEFDVSGVTVRHDLSFLQKEGLIQRIHGGAVLQSEDEISNRLSINFEVKTAIAEKTAEMVMAGDTIFIEAGSANALLAKHLAGRDELTVVTNNVFVTRTLKNSRVNVVLLGGVFQHHSECVVGALTYRGMDFINFTKSFLGVDGISPGSGVTCSEMFRGEVSSRAVEKSQKVFVLTDSSKVGKTAMYRVCEIGDVDFLITDSGIPADTQAEFEEMGVQVIIADA